jgi:multiple sugar transport system permease protein
MPDEPEDPRPFGIGPPQRSNLLFVLPYLLLLALFVGLPLLIGLALSFQDYDMRAGSNGWVGIDNFVKLLHDVAFRGAVRNTLMFVAITVPAIVLLGLALALALNNPSRGTAVFRPYFFAFSMVTVSAATLAWRVPLLPGGRLANFVARMLGAMPADVAHSPGLAVPVIALVTAWWLVGVPMMLFSAALQRVPRDVYEAATLDNASRLRTFLFITLPSVRRTVLLVVMIEIVVQMQVFGQALLIGGDGAEAQSLARFVYDAAFRSQQFGVGAAASQVLLALVAIAALVQVWLSRRWREGI